MNANTLLQNFEVLSIAPGGVSRLRELILNLAVTGKLSHNSDSWAPRTLGEIANIRTGKLDANASSPDGKYPFFTCAKDPLRISSFSYDTECVLLAGNGNFDVNYYFGKFDAYQRTYIIEAKNDDEVYIPYLFRFMQGHSKRLLEQSIGGVIKYIKIGFLTDAPLRLPTYSEQKRIVAKVDELMALCDQLEQQQKQRDNLRTATRKSAIDAISTATTPEELETAWKRINNNWDVIADTPESIVSIRNVINNLAVRGRLSKTEKDEKPIGVPILVGPFDLPPNWRWTRIGDVSNFVNGYAFPSGDYKEKGVGVVRMSDMKNGKIVTSRMKFVSEKYFDELSASFHVSPGDLVMGMTGATLGKPCFNLTSSTFLLNQRIGKFEPFAVDLKYLGIALLTLERLFMEVSFGTGVNNLSTKQIKESVFPIPPLEEQKRIVAKVDQLMALCDQLESELKARGEVAEKFARSVVNAA